MQKRILWIGLILSMVYYAPAKAQYSSQDTAYKKYYIGSTLFLLGNFAPVNSPEFAQLNLGYRLTGKDVLTLELITWKYAWPLGINPFYNSSYGKPEEKFPGYIRDFGLGLAYQRYLYKGLYGAIHAMPMKQIFVDESGKKVGDGFHLFCTVRLGYHIKLFKDRAFIEPSLGIAGRPFHTRMPDGFYQQDDKWPKYTPEPGLHFGFNF
ncbi:MAG: hypothetical protein LPK45_01310 [Bacteroidota bacterium]|nr:hypothetical protein [Bacteroidota bacterium]MDX5429673.1 hypothetical protein [Bacteroidota bacterium]MDX5468451.1 hypothetical protein [Bacteroidota bacterium]